jgi:hypothetical protein
MPLIPYNLMAASLVSSYYPEASPRVYAAVLASSNSLDIGAIDRRDAMLALWEVDRIVWAGRTGSLPVSDPVASRS